jgi:hypothetical protein
LDADIENRMNVAGFALNDVVFGSSGPDAQRLWTKLATILYWFREWEGHRRFAAFRQSFAQAFADLCSGLCRSATYV